MTAAKEKTHVVVQHDFAKGDRVQLSDAGLKAFSQLAKRMPERVGTIKRFTVTALPVVHWDGRGTPEVSGVHPRFLKRAGGAR